MATAYNIPLGLAYGVGAGVLWGLVFLAPAMAHDFGPLQLTAGRYFAYGILALTLLIPRWRKIAPNMNRQRWSVLFGLSLCGNTVYYLMLALSVQLSGIVLASLVIGFLPVVVTFVGSRDRGAVSLYRMAPSLAFGVAGLVCISWDTIARGIDGWAPWVGLLCALGSVAFWAVFAIGNARWLSRGVGLAPYDWGLLIGVTTGLQSLILLPTALLFDGSVHTGRDWLEFGGICLVLALFSSVIGMAWWNRMSQLLPLTMVGQIILFETLFALLYGFWWESRSPTIAEIVSILLIGASVISCVMVHRAAPSPMRDTT